MPGRKAYRMNNSTDAKKQSRVLIVSVAVVAVFATVMILLTALTGRENKDTEPPLVTGGAVTTAAPDSASDRPSVFPKDTKPADTADKPTDAPVSDDPENPDVAAGSTPEDILPDFIAPVSGALAKAHSTEVPVYSLTMDDYRTHTGVDIAAEIGTPVRAAASGTVTEVWDDPMMGKCLRIEHAGGAVSIYKNLAPEIPAGIAAGAAVSTGAVIGAVGESALIETAESAHLHYELYVDGISVNPADFMLIGTADTVYEG